MANIRPISASKYGISRHKFLQAYHFCMQYNEWKDELKYKTDTVGVQEMDGMPRGKGGTSNSTEKFAIQRVELFRKCEIVEQTAIEADAELYQWILKAVTNEGITYTYLKERMNIPCGKKMYYDRRRKFYYLLSKEI